MFIEIIIMLIYYDNDSVSDASEQYRTENSFF